MQPVYAVAVEGLLGLDALDKLPDNIIKAARLAVNATVRRAQKASAKSMERQVNFPRGYLAGKGGRLTISKFASGSDLEGRITGRDRPTSLARFITGPVRLPGTGAPRGGGVTVEVKPGVARRMPTAFAIKLRNGNIGLATRTRDGRRPSMGAKMISPGLYLLFGPSVDQVFVDTRRQVVPDLEDYMAQEFERLVEVGL